MLSLAHSVAIAQFQLAILNPNRCIGTSIDVVLTQSGHSFSYFSKQLTPRLQSAFTYARSKLLGYDFNIIYKPCVQNKPADALSLLLGASFQTLSVVSQPIAIIWDALRRGQQSHSTTTLLISAVTANPAKHPSYSIYYGLLF